MTLDQLMDAIGARVRQEMQASAPAQPVQTSQTTVSGEFCIMDMVQIGGHPQGDYLVWHSELEERLLETAPIRNNLSSMSTRPSTSPTPYPDTWWIF